MGKSGAPHGKGPAQGGPQAVSDDPGYRTYLETPDYFLDPQAQVNYTHVDSRLTAVEDALSGKTTYA